MTFKILWEKADKKHNIPTEYIFEMVKQAFPNDTLIHHQIMSEGCINLNIAITLSSENKKYILRIYLRDKKAALREKNLTLKLKGKVPLPQTVYIGDYKDYTFAITEFIPGITLRNLLLDEKTSCIPDLMYSVGKHLGKISKYTFPSSGFFDPNLNIEKETSVEDLIEFVDTCLKAKKVQSFLGVPTIKKIRLLLEKYSKLIPGKNAKNLVHADFDPANILVIQREKRWEVSGIIDWEFSFSGSLLWDVANMLRYAHQMPSEFKESFLSGILSCSINLSRNWQITVHILNLCALLDSLERADIKKSPIQCADIKELIDYILGQLQETQLIKDIEVSPYNPKWPEQFKHESNRMEKALNTECIEIHHIGSTAIPNLCAKPTIDILCIVKNLKKSIPLLQSIDYIFRGEQNIPLRYYFSKTNKEQRVNLHVVEKDNGFISLNLKFRDYIKTHEKSHSEYANLKNDLLVNPESHKKAFQKFSGYNLGKNQFIKSILDKAGFDDYCFNFCMHDLEWETFHRITNEQLFQHSDIEYDPNHSAFKDPNSFHFILYKGTQITSIARVELIDDKLACLRFLATDRHYKRQEHGKKLVHLLEAWVKSKNYTKIKLHARLSAEDFYRKLDYQDTEFDDPCMDQDYIHLGKIIL